MEVLDRITTPTFYVIDVKLHKSVSPIILYRTHPMSSKYVLANIEIPIEIKPDNTVVPLQQFSVVRVVSVINSLSSIQSTVKMPDILSQANALFEQTASMPPPPPSPPPQLPTEPEIAPPEVSPLQLFVPPEQMRKTPPPFKKNSSFKNRTKYSNRSTAKMREPLN